MKLLFVISALGCGGAERAMSDLANYWAKAGHAVTVVSLTQIDEPDFYPLDLSVSRVRISTGTAAGSSRLAGNLYRILRLRRTIAAIAPDTVVSFIDVTNVITLLATRGLPARVVVAERTDPAHNPTVGRLWRIARKVTYRWADHVVGQTAAVVQWLSDHCGARGVVVPNALRSLDEPLAERQRLIVSIGRLDRLKGHDAVLHAFRQTRVAFPEWRLAILGEGPERRVLEDLIDSLGLRRSATLAGTVTDIEPWLAKVSIVAQGSRLEGFPNAVLEAMGMGAAVISTDCRSGPAELITNGKDGLLVPVDDRDAMADAMLNLMRDPERRARLGAAARDVRNRFSEARVMKLWGQLLGVNS